LFFHDDVGIYHIEHALSIQQFYEWPRLPCFTGRWSMIDIFYGVAARRARRLGDHNRAGCRRLAFCAVVILTMFAAETFDPRLMWDAAAEAQGHAAAEVAS
jgi:uncharacterized paraquat-inducible protein A